MNLSLISSKILAGNILFIACCITYLIWWSIAFRPGFSAPAFAKFSLFLITAILGILGLVMIISGCSQAGAVRTNIFIISAGALAYVVLLLITNIVMHRQVTTELMLIVFWTCMEICACVALKSAGVFGSTALAVIALIVVAAAALGMICYLKYYELEPMTAFYDGMVPLILFAVVMAGIVVFQLRSGS